MKTFKVSDVHLKLLNNANVGWVDCEFGAPAIDCKRPFGNGDVHGDMAKILGFPEEDDNGFPEPMIDYFNKLYKDLETVLQIVLTTGSFESGEYVCDDYRYNWRKK